jgi:hypothetical protein
MKDFYEKFKFCLFRYMIRLITALIIRIVIIYDISKFNMKIYKKYINLVLI